MLKSFNILLFFIICSTNIFAQNPTASKSNLTGSIKGIIKDKDLNTPMEYANIAIYKLKDSALLTGTITKSDGSFMIESIPIGQYYVIIDFIGYSKSTISNVNIYPKNLNINLGLKHIQQSSKNLDAYTVTADYTPVEYKIDKKVVNVSQNLNAAGGTAVDALENIPSVAVDVNGNVSLRGNSNFKVLIDGKPTALEGSDVLNQIPASTIDKIEIITNPSAKYDPEGVSGIMNIITKQNKLQGFSGIVNTSIGTGDKYSGDILINYRFKKFNFFSGVNYNDNKSGSYGTETQKNYYTDTTEYLLKDYERNRIRGTQSIKAGMDYNISKNNALTFNSSYGNTKFGMNNSSLIHNYSQPAKIENYSSNTSGMNSKKTFLSSDLNYLHKFKKEGHEFNTLISYNQQTGDDSQNQSTYYTDEYWHKLSVPSIKNITSEDDKQKTIKIKMDYTLPLKKDRKLELGGQTKIDNKEEFYLFEEFDTVTLKWTANNLFSSNIHYKDNIHAIYGTYSGNYKRYEFMTGLRGEYTDRSILVKKNNTDYKINKFDYFPSIHVSTKIGKTQQIQTSLSKRINRPSGWFLDPNPSYIDAYNIRIGSPDLLPEYTYSYELSYQKRLKNGYFNIEAYHRTTNNKFTRIKELDTIKKINIHKTINLKKDYSTGIELSGNLDILKWYNINVSSSFYRYQIEDNLVSNIDNSSYNWDLRLNNSFKLKTKTRIQLTGMYEGPSITAQGSSKGFYGIDLAIKQDFFKQKLSATLKIRDLLKSMKHEDISKGPNFYSSNLSYHESRVITLSLSYKINNYKEETTRKTMDENPMEERY